MINQWESTYLFDCTDAIELYFEMVKTVIFIIVCLKIYFEEKK
jgi:hypothetical protein